MNLALFLWTSAVLLLVPGPTNTLVCIGASQKGVRGFPRFLRAELSGYASVIIPLGMLSGWLGQSFGTALTAVRLVAASWVLVLAVRMWSRTADTGSRSQVTSRDVYVTTLLNPKAMIFALVLLPLPGSANYLPRLALLAALMVTACAIWTSIGCGVMSATKTRFRPPVERIAAVFLVAVSLSLVLSTLPR
jgi:threonine/homoserine/homoserine lactone efflux protein